MIAEVEEDLINAFVVKRKRERHLAFLRSPKRRRDFLRQPPAKWGRSFPASQVAWRTTKGRLDRFILSRAPTRRDRSEIA